MCAICTTLVSPFGLPSRHPDRASSIFPGAGSRIGSVHGDINDDGSVAAAITGVLAVVNAVSLYVECGKDTFESVHVGAAERVARLAHKTGAERFLHISGIGADTRSASSYIRSRGEGEGAVLRAFPSATLLRPAVMFGPGDAFVTPLLRMLGRLPVFPMFGDGNTRVQPAYVEDVGEASVRILQAQGLHQIYELTGPHIYTYRALLRALALAAGNRPLLLPFPFALWRTIGYLAEFLPSPPITRNQVELMESDSVATPATPAAPGFDTLQIAPKAIEDMLPEILQSAGICRSFRVPSARDGGRRPITTLTSWLNSPPDRSPGGGGHQSPARIQLIGKIAPLLVLIFNHKE